MYIYICTYIYMYIYASHAVPACTCVTRLNRPLTQYKTRFDRPLKQYQKEVRQARDTFPNTNV